MTDASSSDLAVAGIADEFDVIVIGSGSAGLSAAVSALHEGARVAVLERSSKLGGTSAVSGGVPWIPNNHHMHEVGAHDTREQALTYLKFLASDRSEEGMLETYVDAAPQVLQFLETETELRFRSMKWCDYRIEFPGGNFGRSVAPALFDGNSLGDLRAHLRPSATFVMPFTMADLEDGIDILDANIMGERLAKGLVGTGNALIAGLLKAFIDKGGVLERGLRARKLLMQDGVVTGIEAERDGKLLRYGARRGIVLACGGFEWNPQLTRDMLQGPLEGPASPPGNEGDGLLMAVEAGAATANLDEAWWMPTMKIPGEEYDGEPLTRLASAELSKPGSIMVNRFGQRFVNEACNYNDLGRSFFTFDASAYEYPNLPAWLIMHRPYLDLYPVLTRFPGDPIPGWMVQADSLRELAAKIDVDPDGLEATVADFNANVAQGADPEFNRGTSLYDRYWGDRSREGALATLGPLDQGPFFACRVYAGALGTKGGPKINEHAEVLNLRGGAIPGLYAAGNVTANVMGRCYPGAGGTIGPAIVFGHIAGREAGRRLANRKA